MKEATFARYASRLASHCSQWAADCLDLDDGESEMRQEAVDRFLAEVRGRLEHIEKVQAIASTSSRTGGGHG